MLCMLSLHALMQPSMKQLHCYQPRLDYLKRFIPLTLQQFSNTNNFFLIKDMSYKLDPLITYSYKQLFCHQHAAVKILCPEDVLINVTAINKNNPFIKKKS